MKAKNFLFTAVLTFGAILFATNVSGQSFSFGTASTTGTSPDGKVELVLKLKDFQELTVSTTNSKVVFEFKSKADFIKADKTVATALEHLTVFSTKKFNINVQATEFTFDGNLLTGGLGLFTVTATNKGVVNGKADMPVILTTGQQPLFLDSQNRTKSVDGYKIDVDYTLTNPSLLLDKMDDLATATKAEFGSQNEFTSTVTYTIIPG